MLSHVDNSRWQVDFQHQLFLQICAEGLPITSRPHEHRVPVDLERNVSSSNVGIAIINHPPVLTINSWYKLFPNGWFIIGIPTLVKHPIAISINHFGPQPCHLHNPAAINLDMLICRWFSMQIMPVVSKMRRRGRNDVESQPKKGNDVS